jgi:hypothetical protein
MLGLALAPAALAQSKPSYTITTAQMQQAVAQRFPLRYPVGGLVDLELKTPRLRLLPEQNRLATAVDVDASGPALRRTYPGSFDLDFALRYEASDQTIRAHKIEVRSLQMEGLNPGTTELLQAYLPGLVRERLREVVVHTLRPQDLALADAMGMQPDTLTVTREGLVIGFAPKR